MGRQNGRLGRDLVRWQIVILLVMLAYPLAQTIEVHGDTVSNSETVYRDTSQITFSISADSEVPEGESLNVMLSVTGAWWAFYGTLTYDGEIAATIGTRTDPVLDEGRYPAGWSATYSILHLKAGLYDLTFEAYYWWRWFSGGPYGPVRVRVLAEVVQSKPTLTLRWLTPLSNRDSFETGRTIPIRFTVHDATGDFQRDESVTVTVHNATWQEVFSYGTHRRDVRIRESAEYYIVYWKTIGLTPGPYEISVEFDKFNVDPDSCSIELR